VTRRVHHAALAITSSLVLLGTIAVALPPTPEAADRHSSDLNTRNTGAHVRIVLTGETAARWVRAANNWVARRRRSARIVAFVDRGGRAGIRYIEVKTLQPSKTGTSEVCGWLAIRIRTQADPERQIADGGPVNCSDLRSA
jgi:hypothetical protein